MRAGPFGRGDIQDTHDLSLGSGIVGEKAVARMHRGRFGEGAHGELAGIFAVLQLVEGPGRQRDAERALMVLPGLSVAGPIVLSHGAGEQRTSFAVCAPAPLYGLSVEADDADQVRRLLLDDDEPVFFRGAA